jgi:hypothetical protein
MYVRFDARIVYALTVLLCPANPPAGQVKLRSLRVRRREASALKTIFIPMGGPKVHANSSADHDLQSDD